MDTIELLIDSEEIQQLKDKIGNKLNILQNSSFII